MAPSTGLKVVLTGSTGYLGRHFLKQLVDDDRVSTIHAVGVRKDNPKNMPRDVLQQSSKIVVHEGNFALPMLGMPEAEWKQLSETVDIIFHSGADRSLVDYYQVLRPSNFVPTKEIAKLAVGRQIPVHYISGNGVLEIENAPQTGSVAASQPPTNGSDGYVSSKWASEVYLEKVHKKLGLPVHIHRVVSAPEGNQQPAPEVLKGFADIAVALNAMPDNSVWMGSFDVIHAPTLAKTICNSALDTSVKPDAFIHYPAEARLSMTDVEAYLDDRNTSEMKIMPAHYWAGDAKLAGLEYHYATQNMTIGGSFAIKR